MNRKPNSGSFKPGERTGKNHPRWKPRLRFVCEFCDQAFEVQQWVARQKTNKNRFCSVGCRSRYKSVYQSGPNAPDWKGGETTYRGKNWPEARAAVIVAQKGCCADCGKYLGKSLPVHHIKRFSEFDSYIEANQISNLIGLCQPCHMKAEWGGNLPVRTEPQPSPHSSEAP